MIKQPLRGLATHSNRKHLFQIVSWNVITSVTRKNTVKFRATRDYESEILNKMANDATFYILGSPFVKIYTCNIMNPCKKEKKVFSVKPQKLHLADICMMPIWEACPFLRWTILAQRLFTASTKKRERKGSRWKRQGWLCNNVRSTSFSNVIQVQKERS